MATTEPAGPTPPTRSERRIRGRRAYVAALLLLASIPVPAHAATIRLDTALDGADHDAILDGFPGLAPYDGLGDLAGNALAVALKENVTEERALLELPLAPLLAAGVGADQVVSAILTFNVDDVLTTFGPGTDFDGTAAERIHVATYAGDGLVDLDDFARGTPAATVVIGPHGTITDASVRSGGPIVFTADLTASVKSLLAQGATHVGVALSTDDSPTGTSIDDRGDGGTGAPGAGGATMPFLVVTTTDATPTPVPTASPAPSATPSATPSPAPTTSPGGTATPAPTPAPTPTAGPGPTLTPGSTITPVPTSGATSTPGTPTPAPSATPTSTAGTSPSPGATTTPAASATPGTTATPSGTATPGSSPTPRPTGTPAATGDPTLTPTPRPILTASPRATATPGGGTPTPAPTSGTTVPPFTLSPDGSGDQLVYFYDARSGFTTFLNLHNLAAAAIDVRIVLYDDGLSQPFEQRLTLAGGATRTLDVGALREEGLPARFGAALASAVDATGSPVVSHALGGSFTVANLATGSAWGAPAAARRAVASEGDELTIPAPGTTIDGTEVRLRGVRPDRLALSAYYDPLTLEPAALGGNQLVFLSFGDDGVAPVAAATTWSVDARRSDGTGFVADDLTASGVRVTHLESLLGEAAGGAAGSITFSTTGGAGVRLVFFTESLGTFATGYLLPPVAP